MLMFTDAQFTELHFVSLPLSYEPLRTGTMPGPLLYLQSLPQCLAHSRYAMHLLPNEYMTQAEHN